MAWTFDPSVRAAGRALGIAAIIVAMLPLLFSDALVKLAGDPFGLGQIVLLRSMVAAVLVTGALLATTGPTALCPKRSGWVWARSHCLAAMWFSYHAALPRMSFALAAACYYTSPVWKALLARFALGANIGGRGWLAIGLSMAGVILAVDPWPGSISPVLLLPLAAGGFYARRNHHLEPLSGRDRRAMALNLDVCLCAVAGSGLPP